MIHLIQHAIVPKFHVVVLLCVEAPWNENIVHIINKFITIRNRTWLGIIFKFNNTSHNYFMFFSFSYKIYMIGKIIQWIILRMIIWILAFLNPDEGLSKIFLFPLWQEGITQCGNQSKIILNIHNSHIKPLISSRWSRNANNNKTDKKSNRLVSISR